MATRREQPKPQAAPDEGELSFEGAISRLDAIVEQLESAELPLDESLALFEEGVGLMRTSKARLERAEQRVEKLLGYDRHGDPISEPLEDS